MQVQQRSDINKDNSCTEYEYEGRVLATHLNPDWEQVVINRRRVDFVGVLLP